MAQASAPGAHTLTLTAIDAAGNTATQTLDVTLPQPIPLTITNVTPLDGADEVGVTYRPKVTFSRAVDVLRNHRALLGHAIHGRHTVRTSSCRRSRAAFGP